MTVPAAESPFESSGRPSPLSPAEVRRGRRIMAALLLGPALLALGWFIFAHTRDYSFRSFGAVWWSHGGAPAGEIRGRVIDLDRRPVAGVSLGFWDGTTWREETSDSTGAFAVGPGLAELEAVRLGDAKSGRLVLRRRFVRLFRSPNLARGLQMTVQLREER